jgi:hypothetical protein
MGDQPLHHLGRVLGLVGEEVDHPRGRSGVGDRGRYVSMGARAKLGSFQHDGVAERQRHRNRAGSEDHGGVPRGDPDDHASRRANRHRQLARDVRRDDLAEHAVGLRCCLAQHSCGQHAVEHPPAERGSGFLDHRLSDLVLALEDQLAGAREDRAAIAWSAP